MGDFMIRASDKNISSKILHHLFTIALFSFFINACGDSGNNNYLSVDPAVRSMAHMEYLSEVIGQRLAGRSGEAAALNYIKSEFLAMGYQPEIQPFSFYDVDRTASSANLIAVLSGQSDKEIIVGAHYDSVNVGKGYVDNASGIGLMLAMAKRLKYRTSPFTLRFIAFGAEEVGLVGSLYYAAQMSAAEIANTIGMVNLDSIVGGDMIYAYGGADEQGWMREQALNIAATLNIHLQTNPGLNPDYPMGTTGDWSDHAPFRKLGIDYLYFEATNWEIGDLDGYLQTERFGKIYHTVNDNFAFLDREYPGRVESQIRDFARILEEFLLTVNPPDLPAGSILSDQSSKRTIQMRYMHRDGSPIRNLQQ
jgi:hypothetical protein